MDIKDSAKQIANNLLALEINLVISAGMLAQKMPEPAHALLDIAKSYQEYLCRAHARLTPLLQGANLEQSEFTPLEHRYADDATFATLREQADQVLKTRSQWREHDRTLDEEEDVILLRIQGNSDLLRSFFRGLDDRGATVKNGAISRAALEEDEGTRKQLDLFPHELVTLRKIWDIGVDSVVLQTVVQLDGDVVNRIQKGYETAAHERLHALHSELVCISLNQWQFLAKTVMEFVGSVVKGVFGKS